MSENMNGTTIKWAAKNYGALPKVDAVSIQYCGNKGTRKEGSLTVSAFLVMVCVKGVWKSEGVWMHQYGMKTENRRGVYTTIEKAKEAKARILERWGKATKGKAKVRSEVAAKDAEIEAMRQKVAELTKMVAELTAK